MGCHSRTLLGRSIGSWSSFGRIESNGFRRKRTCHSNSCQERPSHSSTLCSNCCLEVSIRFVCIKILPFPLKPDNLIPFLFYSDIGLIKLPKKVQFSETINPVKLACSSASNLNVIAIGNGLMHTSSTELAPILQFTSLKTVPMWKCLSDFPFLLFRKSVICVRGVQQRSSCRGDSGGPLVASDNGALVGLTSFGSSEGCHLGYPQGYTNISSYLEWIKQVTGISDCQK